MTQNALPPASREALEKASKEDLIDLLLLALEGQRQAVENMTTLNTHLGEARAKVQELEDKLASKEAELIVLRNRP